METFKTLYIKLWRRARKALGILFALLLIPIAAWIFEFMYTHYFSRSPQNVATRVSTDHGHIKKTYDYDLPFSLIRKYRRLRHLWLTKPRFFLDSIEIKSQVDRLREAFESERKRFITYYYGVQDRFRGTKIPHRTRRRLMYYRNVLHTKIGQTKQLQRKFYFSPSTKK